MKRRGAEGRRDNTEPGASGPPRFARLVLRLFGARDRGDEIEGDLEDLFHRRVALHGRLHAWRRYWVDALTVTVRRERHGVESAAAGDAAFTTALAFDARQAVRALRRMPSFFVLAGLTLAIGFAAHFAAFTVVDRLLLAAPPHVAQPDALRRVHIDTNSIRGGRAAGRRSVR